MKIYRVTRKVVSEHNQTAEFDNFYTTKEKADKAIDEYIKSEKPYCLNVRDREAGRCPTRYVRINFPNTEYHILVFRDAIEVE